MGIWNNLFGTGIPAVNDEFLTRGVDQQSTYQNILPPTRRGYNQVTVDEALEVSAITRAIQVITISVSQMGFKTYQKGKLIDNPVIVNQPNADVPLSAFIEETAWSLATYGNAYWRVYGEGTYRNLRVLHPNNVHVFVDEKTGLIKYQYGLNETLGTDQIKHLKLNRVPETLEGYGPIQKNGEEIAGIIQLRTFADNWFSNSGIPSGVLRTDADLDPDDAAAYAEAWVKHVEGQGLAVLSNGLEYEYLGIKPQEAQYSDIQEAAVRNVARMFGIPALLLLAALTGVSLTYLTLATTNLNFIQATLIGYMTEIEDALSSLLPRGTIVKFDEQALLRTDPKENSDIQLAQVTAGVKTVNEVRAEMGYGPIATPKPVVDTPVETEATNGE